MEDDVLVKVIVIGDATVGKTSFIYRYVNNQFKSEYIATIGVDFSLKVVRWTEKANIKLQLWDIAGQDRFTSMTRSYYKDATGCILMFDITNKNSFQKVVKWKNDLDGKTRLPDGSPIPCLLVANKTDLDTEQHAVTQDEIVEMCKEHNFVGWTQISVKDGTMVKESMHYLLDVIMRNSSVTKNKDLATADSVSLKKGGEGRRAGQDSSWCSC